MRHSTLTRSEFTMMVAEYLQAVESHMTSECDVDRTEISSGCHHVPSINSKSAPHVEALQFPGSVERKTNLSENSYEVCWFRIIYIYIYIFYFFIFLFFNYYYYYYYYFFFFFTQVKNMMFFKHHK